MTNGADEGLKFEPVDLKIKDLNTPDPFDPPRREDAFSASSDWFKREPAYLMTGTFWVQGAAGRLDEFLDMFENAYRNRLVQNLSCTLPEPLLGGGLRCRVTVSMLYQPHNQTSLLFKALAGVAQERPKGALTWLK